MISLESAPKNETHTIREGESLQVGDTTILVRRMAHDRVTLKVIDPEGRRIKRIDRKPPETVESRN